MSQFEAKTLTVSAEMHLSHTVEQIWSLLCPVREYDWIESWNCELIHSVSGYNELGCVFKTEFPTEGDAETWVTTRFDALSRLEFVRINSDRVIRLEIVACTEGNGTTLHWTQNVVALNEAGNAYIAQKPEAFDAQMKMVARMIDHYLETGTMLRGVNVGLQEKDNANVHNRAVG